VPRVGSADEIVSLVDRCGAVVGRAPRWRVRRDNLMHAATAVLLRDPDGRIYVHRRSAEKDWRPSAYDAAAGGIVHHGEPPLMSAGRELAEELGVSGTLLRPLGRSVYEDDTTRCVEHCFDTTYDGVVTHADGEVVEGTWMTLAELGRLVRDGERPFVPDTRALLVRLCVEGVHDYGSLGLGEHGCEGRSP
jgi:8-oxo-dGTP pyrophosphatase MutT (NUDIX family)